MRDFVAAALLLWPAAPVLAQCPDGAPFPCSSSQPAAALKRANPRLDEQTWIVVPFDNVTRNADVEWLRAGSVNLLYLDLSQWREIRVVDDERVADLIKESPEPRGQASLSLRTALAIARRAGAGKLVMGDLLRVGTRTGVIAKVFSVRDGKRLRSVREETTSADSLIPLFGRLARGILNVPPQTRQSADVGTASIEAYREYVAGVQALNAFDLAEARRRFEKSLQIDSTFALPHYKLSIVIGWENPSDPTRQVHADAAARLGGKLPARERALISGQRKFSSGDYASACDDYGALVRRDSSDVDALYGLAECHFHDDVVEPATADTSAWRFRGSWNTAARAFRRVLAMDPGNYLAFQHILDLLSAETRVGCVRGASSAPCVGRALDYTSAVRRDADSVLLAPLHTALDGAGAAAQADERARTNVRVRNLEEARVLAEAWVGLAPTAARARTSLAHVYLLLGRLDDAERQLGLARGSLPPLGAFQVVLDRVEIAIRRGEGARALTLLDSAARIFRGQPTPTDVTVSLAMANALVGRFGQIDSVFKAYGVMMPRGLLRYYQVGLRAIVTGVAPDSLAALEREVSAVLTPMVGGARATTLLAPTLSFGLRFPRMSWPAIVMDSSERGVWSVVARTITAHAKRDSTGFRHALHSLDSLARSPGASVPRIIVTYVASEAHLVLADSLVALEHLRRLLDTTYAAVPITSTLSAGFDASGLAYPRAMLARADLAHALGQREEARVWYKRFLDLWAMADDEHAAFIADVRRRYARASRDGP